METYKQKLKVDIDKFFEDKDLSTIDIEEKIQTNLNENMIF